MLASPRTAMLASVLLATTSFGGTETLSGSELGLWTHNQYAVVVGKILQYHHRPDDGVLMATLQPSATLCGQFDPSLHPSIDMQIMPGVPSSYQQAPLADATVLAVIMHNDYGYGIISDFCNFMPGQNAIVTIHGLDDPQVSETLKRLQDARAHSEPEDPPTTQGN